MKNNKRLYFCFESFEDMIPELLKSFETMINEYNKSRKIQKILLKGII